ncbi:MAG TPA: leucine-rich repeat protein [Syntrophomonas sp.]|nr:leucine-rich repeat protein [Syntrophomonas sp.]
MMEKRFFSVFLTVCLLFAMLPGLAPSVSALPAPAISVSISDTAGNTALREGASLAAAMTASGTVAGEVYAIAVTSGNITNNDWNYIKTYRMSLSSLTSFSVADAVYAVADMPDSTFQGCARLTEIDIPDVGTIGQYAFSQCDSLTEVELPDATTFGDNAFFNCDQLAEVELPKATSLGNYVFYNCPALTEVALPQLTSAGERAFAYCQALTGVSLPKLTSMGANMFYNCIGLAYAAIPRVTSIGSEGFKNCISLTALKVPGTPPAVGADAFMGTPETRRLIWVDANGDELTGDDLDHARTAYKAAEDGNTEDNLWYGWQIPMSSLSSIALDIGAGDIVAYAGPDSTFTVRQGSRLSNLVPNGTITITGTTGANKIVVDSVYANITLNNVAIDVSASENSCAFSLINGARVSLTLAGDNRLTSGKNRAGLEVARGQSITIDGNDTDSLTAASGGDFPGGAGIGGGGFGFENAGGTINITGGTITATGGNWATGIGGGRSGAGGAISISGGIIKAAGGGSGIGGGAYAEGGTINISAGNVTAIGGSSGIGGGYNNGSASNPACDAAITIMEAAAVKASSEYAGEAISANSGTLAAGSTARILAANFTSEQSSGVATAVYRAVYGTPVTDVTPGSSYNSIAFTLPEGAYNLKAAGRLQQYTNTGAPTSTDFEIPAATGIYTFDKVENAAAAYHSGGNGGDDSYQASPGLPYYIKDGKKVFIGLSATGGYIAPEGVTVLFGENPKRFTDIENHWAKASIDFVTEREIFQGIDKNNFGPETAMTRAMFVTVIGRLYEHSYGSVTGHIAFSDVDEGAYYADYVAWAHENGIIEGIGAAMFAPDAEVTREQMAEIIFRFAAFLGKTTKAVAEVTYPDQADISGWAMGSVAYCQSTGIITGGDGGSFAPKSAASRAEVAVVIERFIKEMLK